MIKRIQNSEYLKYYGNMNAEEKKEYESRVGQWLSESGRLLAEKSDVFEARMQNVLQVSASWNDQECQAFEEGVRLLTALIGVSDTWLPDMLYVKSAKRCIKRMFELLWSVDEGKPAGETSKENADQEPKEEHAEGTSEETHAVGEEPADENSKGAEAAKEAPMQPTAPFQAGAGDGGVGDGHQQAEAQVDLVPVRPKHIDQYVHLLPQKTQEHASQVQALYRELDEAREKMNLLMNDSTASAADREAWAKKATKCDNALRKIFDELDAEWAKLVKEGRVVVDDLGNARVVDIPQDEEPQNQELTSEQRARRRDLRKWLVDTRRGNGDNREEWKTKWIENFKEFQALDGDNAFKDEKVMAAMEHYGIDVKDVK